MSSTRSMTPRERLKFFFTTVEPKADTVHIVAEILTESLEEWVDLCTRLLEKGLAENVCRHEFLDHLKENEAEALEGLNGTEIVTITKAFGIDNARQDLATQFIIDGFDVWLTKQDIHRVSTLLTSCGVQPELVKAAAATSRERLNDFLITLMFPEKEDRENHGDFLASLKAMHQAPTVEDYNTTPPPGSPLPEGARAAGSSSKIAPISFESKSNEAAGSSTRGKRDRDGETGTAATADQPDDLVISEETLPELLEKNPDVIPREILRAHRRPIAGGITEFALENHYTMNELRDYVKTNNVVCPRKQLKVDVARSIIAHLNQEKDNGGEGDEKPTPA